MHRHPEPVSGFFTAHLVNPVGNLTDSVQIPHRGQDPEEQAEIKGQVFVESSRPESSRRSWSPD